jgi:8-oxo-dGTP pyrophosphatase MutT (NUDIX family)
MVTLDLDMGGKAPLLTVLPGWVAGTQIKLGVAVVVLNARGELLLEKRRDCGLWGLLGGRVDPGESVRETILREVREESGLEVEMDYLIGIYSGPAGRIVRYPEGDVKQLVDVAVSARILPAQGEPRCSPESLELAFFAPDRLPPRETLLEPARRPLEDFLAGGRALIH